MKRALIINLGWEQQPLIDRLRRQECELFGIHPPGSDGRKRAAELAEHFEEIHLCDLRDLPGICQFADRIRPELVISDQCDYSHFAQAVVAERHGLPGPSLEAAQVSGNKLVQRQRAAEKGIDIPAFRPCIHLDEARRAAREIGFPVILKPVDNRGSFGVHKVTAEEQLADAFHDSLVHSHSRSILVEEFVAGVHITVDGYAFPRAGCRSLALATKGLLPNTSSQVAVDILYPGELPDSLYQTAMRTNERVNRELGYRFGMTHSEYMVTGDGRVVLIESANRGGGCFTSEIIVPYVSGVDLVGQYLTDASGDSGDSPDHDVSPRRQHALLKFVTFENGVITKLEGFDRICRSAGVLAGRLRVRPGDTIEPVDNDANRHGFIIYADPDATSATEIRAAAQALLAQMEIETRPLTERLLT